MWVLSLPDFPKIIQDASHAVCKLVHVHPRGFQAPLNVVVNYGKLFISKLAQMFLQFRSGKRDCIMSI